MFNTEWYAVCTGCIRGARLSTMFVRELASLGRILQVRQRTPHVLVELFVHCINPLFVCFLPILVILEIFCSLNSKGYCSNESRKIFKVWAHTQLLTLCVVSTECECCLISYYCLYFKLIITSCLTNSHRWTDLSFTSSSCHLNYPVGFVEGKPVDWAWRQKNYQPCSEACPKAALCVLQKSKIIVKAFEVRFNWSGTEGCFLVN